MLEANAQYVTALMLLGIGWAFVRADPRTATSRALAVALAAGGLSVIATMTLTTLIADGPLPGWARYLVVPELLALAAAFEWVYRVRRTIPASGLRTRFGDGVLRVGQGLLVLYALNSFLHPDLRVRYFFGGLDGGALWSASVVRLFVAPLGIAMLLWALSIFMCLKRDPEPAERIRLNAFLIAVPLMISGLVLPVSVAPVTTVLGLTILVAGALHHAQLKGRQGQFMSRFLSPQVATLVNHSGLRAAMREQRRELSVVCIDLRGFTAFASANSSQAVIELLRDYYDAVGAAAREFEATVKDYAGDGVLILLGAPVPVADHARQAVALALRIRALVAPVTAARQQPGFSLDSGIAIASGEVTVGIIGGEGRLEYAAVGQAVNLASRLCEKGRRRRNPHRRGNACAPRRRRAVRRARAAGTERISAAGCQLFPARGARGVTTSGADYRGGLLPGVSDLAQLALRRQRLTPTTAGSSSSSDGGTGTRVPVSSCTRPRTISAPALPVLSPRNT